MSFFDKIKDVKHVTGLKQSSTEDETGISSYCRSDPVQILVTVKKPFTGIFSFCFYRPAFPIWSR